MLDWHTCQICYSFEMKLLLLYYYYLLNQMMDSGQTLCIVYSFGVFDLIFKVTTL